MSNDTQITLVGNVTGEPELRYTPGGRAVCNFTVASTPSSYDKATSSYVDGETLFMRCSVWRDTAEHVAESLARGSRVVVTGRVKSRSYEAKDGTKRTSVELDVDEIGPSLRYATATVKKAARLAAVPATPVDAFAAGRAVAEGLAATGTDDAAPPF
jgi:single-strand DNA-binding protein